MKLVLFFISSCFGSAFSTSALITNTIIGGIGSPIVWLPIWYWHFTVPIPNIVQDTNNTLFIGGVRVLIVTVLFFGVVFLIRLMFSPFLIWKDQQEKIEELTSPDNSNPNQHPMVIAADKMLRATLKQEQMRTQDKAQKMFDAHRESLKKQKQNKKDDQFLAEYKTFLQKKIQQAEQMRNRDQFFDSEFYLEVFYWYETVYNALEISFGSTEAYKLNAVYHLAEIGDDSNRIVALRKALLEYTKHLQKLKTAIEGMIFLETFNLSMLEKFSGKSVKTE